MTAAVPYEHVEMFHGIQIYECLTYQARRIRHSPSNTTWVYAYHGITSSGVPVIVFRPGPWLMDTRRTRPSGNVFSSAIHETPRRCMRNVICATVIIWWAGAAACNKSTPASSEPLTASSRDSTRANKGDSVIDEAKARDLALEEVRQRGKDPTRYDLAVQGTDTEWAVEVAGKAPRAPGDEMMIYINKTTGKLRVMLGE